MIIGHYAGADTYTVEICIIHIQRSHVVLRPLTRLNHRKPDYRVVQDAEGGAVELGAAWRRRTEKGQDYLSVLLDDAALPKPLNVALFQEEGKALAKLVWNRITRPTAPDAQPRATGRRRPAAGALAGPGHEAGALGDAAGNTLPRSLHCLRRASTGRDARLLISAYGPVAAADDAQRITTRSDRLS